MLLPYHRNYIKEALSDAAVGTDEKKEIIIGSTANDLCEVTEEGWLLLSGKDFARRLFRVRRQSFKSAALYWSYIKLRKEAFSFSAFYQSHFGKLSAMHTMANVENESPETTKNEISAWFDFLNNLALGVISIEPDREIQDDHVAVSPMFSGLSIKYEQIFDTKDRMKIKLRALGMMCHLIEDLFTQSHCRRNSHNEISMFYCYHLQDKEKHKEGDLAVVGLEQELIRQCGKCIESIRDNRTYDYSQVLTLSNDAQDSGAGDFS